MSQNKFQITKIGLLPNDWQVTPLNNYADIITKGTTPTTYGFDYEEEGINFVKIESIDDNGKFKIDQFARISEEAHAKLKRSQLKNNDLLVTIAGNLGRVAIVNEEILPANTNQAVAIVRFSEKNPNDIRFIYHFLKGYSLKRYIQMVSTVGAQPNLSLKQVGEIDLALPPLKEQQKIAAILSSIDEAIEKTEQIIEQTETVKKGLMQQLLMKGIGHENFKKSPIGSIPEKWEVLSFNKVFERITTKNKNNNQNVLTISGEKGLINQLEYFNKSVSSKNLSNYIYLENGDFAYNKSYSNGYPLGAIKMLDKYDAGVVSTLYICFRLKDPNIREFYKHYFDSGFWNKQVYTIAPEGGRSHGLLNVGVRDFFEILIPVPPTEEQKEISDRIDSVQDKINIEKERLSELNDIKQGLMQQLLTGKLRVKINEDEEVPS